MGPLILFHFLTCYWELARSYEAISKPMGSKINSSCYGFWSQAAPSSGSERWQGRVLFKEEHSGYNECVLQGWGV